CQQVYSSPLTF
nr:immunoglobulin light chain junction region [Macaca mulatta]MOW42753.1 immunoglobulin light chain junction region [Macaca mulatta]